VLPYVLLTLHAPLPPGWECRRRPAPVGSDTSPSRSAPAAPAAAHPTATVGTPTRGRKRADEGASVSPGGARLGASPGGARLGALHGGGELPLIDMDTSVEEFLHVGSGRTLPHHPLLGIYRRLVHGELKRRRGSRYATFACHEWLLIAAPAPPKAGGSRSASPARPHVGGSSLGSADQSGWGNGDGAGGALQPMWINLVTGKRCVDFPDLTEGSQPREGVYQRRNGWSDAQRTLKAFYELTTLRQMVGRVPSARAMRERSRAARARALARRPLTMLEVLYAAELMGVDAFEHPELMFLAEEALCLELPLGWEPVETGREDGAPEGGVYFHNSILQLSQWLHPKLTYLIALARAYGAPDAATNEDIEHD